MEISIPAPEAGSRPAGAANPGAGRGLQLSLRTKGTFAFILLVLYVLLAGYLIGEQRSNLNLMVGDLQRLHEVEERLARVNTSIAHAILNVNEAFYAEVPRSNVDGISLDIEAIQSGLASLGETYPGARARILELDGNIAGMRADRGRVSLFELRETLHRLVSDLDGVTTEVRERRASVSNAFRHVYDAMTLTGLVMGGVGVVVFGTLVALFFTRLVRDIGRLEARAIDVAAGYRGEPMPVVRGDEVGGLMNAVNRMQIELDRREKQLEITRLQHFHQEKMAAIGSLASAIAHEINNPIAAIAGVAESINDVRRTHHCPTGGTACQPGLILEQTRRIAQITRQLSGMTAPYSAEPQLLDFNALIRNTCSFISYDKRFRNIHLATELDSQLPAVKAVADHLTQVLMNLLINAADALEGVADRKPEIRVVTRARKREIELAVTDNGCGMDAATLARAFESAFTTKYPRGSGVGLYMCRELIEAEGGRIFIESTPGTGTQATVILPEPKES